jgi:hypothetical protein
MTEIDRFERDLNSDRRLRAEFLRDPAGVMRRRGFVISHADEEKIKRSVAMQSQKPPSGSAKTEWEASIKIKGTIPSNPK